MGLCDIFSTTPEPEMISPRSCRAIEIECESEIDQLKTEPAKFEKRVFNCLWANKKQLRLKKVERLQNCLIDGRLECEDGRIVGLEMKYAMNWCNACKAGWQLQKSIERYEASLGRFSEAIVIFDHFTGDWDRGSAGRNRKNGWNRWYEDHYKIGKLKVHLLQFTQGRLINLDGKTVYTFTDTDDARP
jgi:hypothetical protein